MAMLFWASIGLAAALVLSLIRRREYGYSLTKAVATTFLFMAMAVVGAYIMGVVEGGMLGNISFYGSIFMVPISIVIYCLITKEDSRKMLDYFVPQICAGLAPTKIMCLVSGCCYGIKLFEKADGSVVRFPSQIIEMLASLTIMFVLVTLEKKNKFSNLHFPLFLVMYGAIRFILNCFRGDLVPFVWFLPAGHFWSIVAIVIGLMWLLLEQKDDETITE